VTASKRALRGVAFLVFPWRVDGERARARWQDDDEDEDEGKEPFGRDMVARLWATGARINGTGSGAPPPLVLIGHAASLTPY
jgi:hypothetical protein